jgi:hypothetical protein
MTFAEWQVQAKHLPVEAVSGLLATAPAFSGLRTTDLSPLVFNNLTSQSGPSFVTIL